MGELTIEELQMLRHLVGLHIVRMYDNEYLEQMPQYIKLESKLFKLLDNENN